MNWLQLAGFSVAGVNETGARIGSAILTIGTCLLTWDIARRLFDPAVGAWAGVVMATCLWTGIAGRAATPDAPLAFLTTLALASFVRGVVHAGGLDRPVRLPTSAAVATGAAAGAAMLAVAPLWTRSPAWLGDWIVVPGTVHESRSLALRAGVCTALVAASFVIVASSEFSPFIYFQF